MYKKITHIVILLLLVVAIPIHGFAVPAKPFEFIIEEEITELKSRITLLEAKNNWINFTISGSMIAVILGFFIFYFIGQTKQDFEEKMRKTREEFEKKAQQMLKEALDEQAKKMDDHIKYLESILEKEFMKRKLKILVTGKKEELDILEKELNDIFGQQFFEGAESGFTYLPYDEKTLITDIEKYDMILYNWIPDDKALSRLQFLIDTLIEKTTNMPLIIYTKEKVNFNEIDKRYKPFITMCNSSVKIPTNIDEMIHYVLKKNKKSA